MCDKIRVSKAAPQASVTVFEQKSAFVQELVPGTCALVVCQAVSGRVLELAFATE